PRFRRRAGGDAHDRGKPRAVGGDDNLLDGLDGKETVLGVDHDEIECSDGEELRHSGGRPGEKAAEKRLVRENAGTERSVGCQLSALSFRRRDASILLTSVTLPSRESYSVGLTS